MASVFDFGMALRRFRLFRRKFRLHLKVIVFQNVLLGVECSLGKRAKYVFVFSLRSYVFDISFRHVGGGFVGGLAVSVVVSFADGNIPLWAARTISDSGATKTSSTIVIPKGEHPVTKGRRTCRTIPEGCAGSCRWNTVALSRYDVTFCLTFHSNCYSFGGCRRYYLWRYWNCDSPYWVCLNAE